MSRKKPVVVVTGASRGAGAGIAEALGSYGCTVYLTGRTEETGAHTLPGTIFDTAEKVNAAGGKGIAVRVDHADDEQVKALFERIEKEEGGIDILVNNACALNDQMSRPGNFWEKPVEIGDMLDVGLRSSYVTSYYAAPLLINRGRGLIIFTSSSGSVHYFMGPAYGAHKAGLDKFAFDMGLELKDYNVACLSIWMGPLLTERLKMVIRMDPEKYQGLEERTETPQFTGHIIWALFNDPNLMDMTGQTVIGAEMAVKYGIQDAGGRQPASYRDTHNVAPIQYYPALVGR